jgi:hypothetical protein
MKTVRQHLDSGISSEADLQEALQLAMQLEFSTIPPYLCAQWSIREDPDRVEAVLHRIVNQEMYHFALAGNVLAAIGGIPSVANESFVPSYPMHALPGGIAQPTPIDLAPLDRMQLRVFMQIEHPDLGRTLPSTQPPATIGDFYNAIIAALKAVAPAVRPNAYAIPIPHFSQIKGLPDAVDTLERIKDEGEGLGTSPEEPPGDVDRPTLAHYYAFKELYTQRRLVRRGGRWSFTGAPIILPSVWTIGRSESQAETAAFSDRFSALLRDLESCWTRGRAANIVGMFELQLLGKELIHRGVRPEFVWRP